MGRRTSRVALGCALLLPLCLLGGLTACQTRLVGSRTPDYDLPRGQNSGIPFRLSRPVFVIREVREQNSKGEEKPVRYELVVEYRSDPTAVYWITVEPAEFHKSNLALSFTRLAQGDLGDDPSSHGFVVGAGAEGGDQSKGFFEAVGKFATDAVGLYVLTEGNARASSEDAAASAAILAGGNLFQRFTMQMEAPPDLALFGPEQMNRAARTALGPTIEFPEDQKELLQLLRPQALVAVKNWKKEWKSWLIRFRQLTGIDLRPLHQLFVVHPILKPLLEEALVRPSALPGQSATDLTTLKETIRTELLSVVVQGGFEVEAYRTANLQAHLQLLSHHRLLDRIEQRTQPSDEYAAVERRMFAAAGERAAWDEKRRLEAFLESAATLYEAGSPVPPEPGFVHELQEASKRVAAIDAAIVLLMQEITLSHDPSEPLVSESGPQDTWTSWKETELEICRPRWLYQPAIPGPTVDRAEWLRMHLQRLNGNGEPANDREFIVLVERSYPDREIRLDGRLIGQVSEIQPLCQPKGN